jgi:hypothetical protein
VSYTDDLRAFTAKVESRQRDILVGCVDAVHGSVTQGSAVTGAPGQPVDTGDLLASWQETFPEEWVGQTATNVEYAPQIEEGVGEHGPLTLRSQVGGFHSVALTRMNFDLVVKDVVSEVVR